MRIKLGRKGQSVWLDITLILLATVFFTVAVWSFMGLSGWDMEQARFRADFTSSLLISTLYSTLDDSPPYQDKTMADLIGMYFSHPYDPLIDEGVKLDLLYDGLEMVKFTDQMEEKNVRQWVLHIKRTETYWIDICGEYGNIVNCPTQQAELRGRKIPSAHVELTFPEDGQWEKIDVYLQTRWDAPA